MVVGAHSGDFVWRSGGATYTPGVKTIWTGRVAQAAGKYGESAPMATVCCNACRTCVTSNVVAIVTAAVASVGYAVGNFARGRIASGGRSE
jgi:hypothetical protein